MCAASAAGSDPLNQLTNFNPAQAQQVLEAIRRGEVPTDDAFVNLQHLLSGAIDYARMNEQRVRSARKTNQYLTGRK